MLAVAKQMSLSWDEVSGIQERAAKRGLAEWLLRGVWRKANFFDRRDRHGYARPLHLLGR